MRRPVRWLALWLVVLAVFPATAAETLRVAYFELRPHGFTNDAGQPEGAAIAYVRAVAEEMGVPVCFIELPLPRLLQGRGYDMALYLARTPERERALRFATTPLFTMRGALAVRQSPALQPGPTRINSGNDLRGMRIGVDSARGFRSPLLDQPGLILEPLFGVGIQERALRMVTANRIDAFYLPESVALSYYVERAGLGATIALRLLPEHPVALLSAFTNTASPDLPTRYEQALQRLPYERKLGDYLRRETAGAVDAPPLAYFVGQLCPAAGGLSN